MSYFIRLHGKPFGPFDQAQILKMRNTGKLGRTTEISENKVDWTPAGSVEWLYTQAPPPPAPLVTTTSTAPPPPSTDWYYSIDGSDGYGPFTELSITELIWEGRLDKHSYAWRQGENARALGRIPEFSGCFQNEPWKQSSRFIGIGSLIIIVTFFIGGFFLVRGTRSTDRQPFTPPTGPHVGAVG